MPMRGMRREHAGTQRTLVVARSLYRMPGEIAGLLAGNLRSWKESRRNSAQPWNTTPVARL